MRVLFVSGAYFICDYVILKYFIKAEMSDPKAKLSYVHHVMGIFSLFLAVYGGYALPAVGNIAMLSEISTIFLNYRDMYQKEERGQTALYRVNFFIFVLTFTVFRIFLFPYCIYLAGKDIQLTWEYLTMVRKLSIVLMIAFFAIIFVINLFWYKIILSVFKKNMSPSKTDDEDNYERMN